MLFLPQCRHAYSQLQDHIFTKAHIDNTKAFLNSHGDLDHDLSSSGFPGMFQHLNEADQTSRRWDSSASSLQNTQLQSVPVSPATAKNYGLSQGGFIENGTDFWQDGLEEQWTRS